jgi:hypothetical protein
MIRVADGVYVLPIPRGSRAAEGFLNLTSILDNENGSTRVDAGLPGQTGAIGSALGEAGIGVWDLRRIIFIPRTSTTSVREPPSCARAARGCLLIPPMLLT